MVRSTTLRRRKPLLLALYSGIAAQRMVHSSRVCRTFVVHAGSLHRAVRCGILYAVSRGVPPQGVLLFMRVGRRSHVPHPHHSHSCQSAPLLSLSLSLLYNFPPLPPSSAEKKSPCEVLPVSSILSCLLSEYCILSGLLVLGLLLSLSAVGEMTQNRGINYIVATFETDGR